MNYPEESFLRFLRIFHVLSGPLDKTGLWQHISLQNAKGETMRKKELRKSISGFLAAFLMVGTLAVMPECTAQNVKTAAPPTPHLSGMTPADKIANRTINNSGKKSSLKLNKTKITMLRYHSYKLKVKGTKKKVKWSSQNENIASVDEYGVITAVNEGKTEITAAVGKKKLTCKLTITDPNPKDVLAAYGYKALQQALPENADLKINGVLTGTSLQNKDLVYYDCTFKDLRAREIHAYIEVYRDFGESLSYFTVKTKFYQDNVILRFRETPLDSFALSKCSKAKMSTIKDVAKTLFKLEKITVKKGENFDETNPWLVI